VCGPGAAERRSGSRAANATWRAAAWPWRVSCRQGKRWLTQRPRSHFNFNLKFNLRSAAVKPRAFRGPAECTLARAGPGAILRGSRGRRGRCRSQGGPVAGSRITNFAVTAAGGAKPAADPTEPASRSRRGPETIPPRTRRGEVGGFLGPAPPGHTAGVPFIQLPEPSNVGLWPRH